MFDMHPRRRWMLAHRMSQLEQYCLPSQWRASMGFIMTCVLGNAGMWRCRTGFLIVTKGVPDLSLFRAADKSRLHLFSRPPAGKPPRARYPRLHDARDCDDAVKGSSCLVGKYVSRLQSISWLCKPQQEKRGGSRLHLHIAAIPPPLHSYFNAEFGSISVSDPALWWRCGTHG